jgi:hypothetical protein
MGVAPEVTQDGGCAPEGGLRIDHPVGVEERVDEGAPRSRRAQVLAAAGEVKFVAVVGAAKRLDTTWRPTVPTASFFSVNKWAW